MFKAIREQFWYISAFIRKYYLQILTGVALTVGVYFVIISIVPRLPKQKPTYRIGLVGQYSSSQLPSVIVNLLKGGLTSTNEKLETIANLAEKWDVQDNGLLYSFTLRPDLKWSSGEPVKPSDIKIAIPKVTVEVVDPNIIKFRIPSKFSPFPSLLSYPLVNSKGKVISDFDIKIKQKNNGVLTQVLLESSSQKIYFNLYPTAKQAVTAYKLGQLDLVLNIPKNTQEQNLEKYGQIENVINKNQVVLIYFNQADPILKDKNLRQGIAYSLSDKSFGEDPADTTLNPDSWAYNPLTKTYPYNQARSQELIKKGVILELSSLPELLPVAENIKKQLESDNLKINIKVVTSTPDQFQLFLSTYNIPSDPDQYRDWHSTQSTNIGKAQEEKIDKFLEDGRTTLDPKERKRIYFDFQKAFSEELPALVLYHPSYFNLARKAAYFNLINQSL